MKLIPLIVMILIGCVKTAPVPRDRSMSWSGIAAISGNDRISLIHITNLFRSYDIESIIEGSVLYGVSVPQSRTAEALKILRTDAQRHGYYVWFGKNDVVMATVPKTMITRSSASGVLENPEFAGETILGRFLRSEDISRLTSEYPYIISLS